jgi:hypothetical protein
LVSVIALSSFKKVTTGNGNFISTVVNW